MVSPATMLAVAADRVNESACERACEGTTDKRPKPIAATATSAIRLIVVFVDICFLSIVTIETFSIVAGTASRTDRCIARADASNSPPCIRTRRGNLIGERFILNCLPYLLRRH